MGSSNTGQNAGVNQNQIKPAHRPICWQRSLWPQPGTSAGKTTVAPWGRQTSTSFFARFKVTRTPSWVSYLSIFAGGEHRRTPVHFHHVCWKVMWNMRHAVQFSTWGQLYYFVIFEVYFSYHGKAMLQIFVTKPGLLWCLEFGVFAD